MMTSETRNLIVRVTKAVMCVLVAAVLVWRSNTYTDPSGPGMMPSVVCTIAAMFLVFLGLAIGFQTETSDDIEFDVKAE
jgi:hypothetical protein